MAQGSKAEIQLGKLAEQKASSPAVKRLARQIQTDHRRLLAEEEPVAKQLGIELKAQPTEEAQLALQRLQNLSRDQFDDAFAKEQVEDHHEDIELTRQEMASSNPQVSALAKKALPILEKHEQLARAAQK